MRYRITLQRNKRGFQWDRKLSKSHIFEQIMSNLNQIFDRRFMIIIGIWTILKMVLAFQYFYLKIEFDPYHKNLQEADRFIIPLIGWTVGLFLIRILIFPAYEKISRLKLNWAWLLHIPTAFVFVLLYSFLIESLINWSHGESIAKLYKMEEMLAKNFADFLLIYPFVIGILYAFQFRASQQKEQIQNLQLESNLIQAKLNNLKAQLHPHFLFNTHNSILELMDTAPEKAKKMLDHLSSLMRSNFKFKNIQWVTLEEEIYLLNKYLSIEKVRFSDHLNYDIEIPDRLAKHPVPYMLLQPLVENAIRHGFGKGVESLNIKLRATRKDQYLILQVIDSGKGFDANLLNNFNGKGTGLSNVYNRLNLLYGKTDLIKIDNSTEGTQVVLLLPINSKINRLNNPSH